MVRTARLASSASARAMRVANVVIIFRAPLPTALIEHMPSTHAL
jgi:hypothetical protein